MAENSWPFDGVNTTEDQYRRLLRNLGMSGVLGAYGDNTLKVTADGSGMNVKITTGTALVESAFFYENTQTKTITVEPNSAGTPRMDAVVLRVDLTANNILAVIKKGTPATNPVRPSLVNSGSIFEMLVADVLVASGAVTITSAAVTDRRTYALPGVGVWDAGTLPENPTRYQIGVNATTQSLVFWNGTAWVGVGSLLNALEMKTGGKHLLNGAQIFISTGDPSSAQGADGDFWYKHN